MALLNTRKDKAGEDSQHDFVNSEMNAFQIKERAGIPHGL